MRRRRATALLILAVAVVAMVVAVSGGGASSATSAARQAAIRAHGGAAVAGPRARPPAPRRSARQIAVARAVAWAEGQARRHMHEIGTTNCSPAIARWEHHMNLYVPPAPPCRPWCGAFLHEALLRGGFHMSSRLIDPNESYADALAHRNGLRSIPKADVRPGDILFFELDPGVQASHAALVVGTPHDGRVRTAEGNVGHHAVLTRRGLKYAVLAARVTRRPRV